MCLRRVCTMSLYVYCERKINETPACQSDTAHESANIHAHVGTIVHPSCCACSSVGRMSNIVQCSCRPCRSRSRTSRQSVSVTRSTHSPWSPQESAPRIGTFEH